MVITIAYHNKPDEILYSFSKVGDTVCIGRDKRQCKIALGVNAEGVSRVHLKLELLSNGCLLARDTSTYGTGYDGGPFVVEKEKELKPSAILQIGSFCFVIKENVEQKCIEEVIANPFARIAKINSRKRLASNKAAVVVEEECISQKRRMMSSMLEKLGPEINDSEVVMNKEGGLGAHTGSNLNTDEAWIQEQDKKLVEKLGREEKEKIDSAKLAYCRKIADFLPSDDEDDQESRQSKSKVSMSTMADSSRNMDSIITASLQYDSSNNSICDVVQDTYLSVADISVFSKKTQHSNTSEKADGLFKKFTSMKIMPESGTNDSILAEAKENGVVDDISSEKFFKPLFSSTQLPSSREKLEKSGNESSTIKKNDTLISHSGRFNFLESQNVSKRFCDVPFKTVPKEKYPIRSKVINRKKTIATGLTSWLGLNTAKKQNNQCGNQSDTDEVVITSKRIKIEVVEDENKEQESEKNESSIGNKSDCEANNDENDGTLGMDIEVLRMKLRKAVQYENLERPILVKNRSQSDLTGRWKEFNCKRFKKAAQGSYSGYGLLHSAMTRIVGVADLIDFKEIV